MCAGVVQTDSSEEGEPEMRGEEDRMEEEPVVPSAYAHYQLDLPVATPDEEISEATVDGQPRLTVRPDVECHERDGPKPRRSVQITEMKTP